LYKDASIPEGKRSFKPTVEIICHHGKEEGLDPKKVKKDSPWGKMANSKTETGSESS
jgi:hypothetical protein